MSKKPPRFFLTWSMAAMLFAAPASAVIDLPGATQATFQWASASGPVTGYNVYVRLNGGAESLYGSVYDQTQQTIQASPGDTIRVSVAAFDEGGVEGPRSPASELVRLVAQSSPPPNNPIPLPGPSTPPPLGPAPLDFDGDGLSDILLANKRTGETRVLTMQVATVVRELSLAPMPRRAKLVSNADHDGDGVADALCLKSGGQLEMWLVRGGAVVAQTEIGLPLPRGFNVVGSGDFDGDGRADVAVYSARLGVLQLWYLDGTTLLEIIEIVDAPTRGWTVVGTGDYDGDGVAEVLWQGRRGGELLVWRFATGSVEEIPLPPVGRGIKLRDVGDLNGDGRSDLLLMQKGGTLAVALLGPTGVLNPSPIPGLRLRYTASGDFDGDGHVDLLFDDKASKTRLVYFMNGTVVEQIEPLGAFERGWFEAGASR